MVGFLKLLKVITKYSVNYTRQCKYITCIHHKLLITKCQLTTDFTYTSQLNLLYTNKRKNHICGC